MLDVRVLRVLGVEDPIDPVLAVGGEFHRDDLGDRQSPVGLEDELGTVVVDDGSVFDVAAGTGENVLERHRVHTEPTGHNCAAEQHHQQQSQLRDPHQRYPALVALVIIVIVILLVGLGVVLYNRLIRLRNKVEEAWAQIDVHCSAATT